MPGSSGRRSRVPDEPKGFAGPFKNQIGNVGQRTEPMLEAYTLLGAIAARTTRASLGTMVTGVTYRNPALLAKIVTTLDVVSRGRAILGLGAAWNDDEHAGYGFEFPAVGERMGRLEEALQILPGYVHL